MRQFLFAAVAACGLILSGTAAIADKHEEGDGWEGVLIDVACGSKQKNEASAADHPKACAMKEACAKSGYGLFAGDKFIKFDAKGNEKAKEYLAVDEHGTKVHVTGKLSKDGKMITVSEIHAQDEEQKSDDKKESK